MSVNANYTNEQCREVTREWRNRSLILCHAIVGASGGCSSSGHKFVDGSTVIFRSCFNAGFVGDTVEASGRGVLAQHFVKHLFGTAPLWGSLFFEFSCKTPDLFTVWETVEKLEGMHGPKAFGFGVDVGVFRGELKTSGTSYDLFKIGAEFYVSRRRTRSRYVMQDLPDNSLDLNDASLEAVQCRTTLRKILRGVAYSESV